jgi:hypothetical protein
MAIQRLAEKCGRQRLVALMAFVVFGVGSSLAFPGQFAQHIEMPLAFNLRALMGLEPEVSERLVAFAIDDRTWDYLGEKDLQVDDWNSVLHAIAGAHPKTIIINKSFSDHITAFHELSARYGVQVVLPSLVSEVPRSHRPVLYNGLLSGLDGVWSILGPVRQVTGNFQPGHANPTRPGHYLPVLASPDGNVMSVHLGLAGAAPVL